MTLCESCGENKATVQLVEIVQGVKSAQRLCDSCAEKRGIGLTNSPNLDTLQSFLDSVMEPMPEMQAPDLFTSSEEAALRHFQATGKFGHPDDYKLLKKYIEPFLQKIHGSIRHRGKIPQSHKTHEHEIAVLTDQMNEAAATEKYEEAAKLRDHIRDLNRK